LTSTPAFDPTVVSIDAATGIITVDENLASYNGISYSMTITATDAESTSGSPSATFAFVLTLDAACAIATLTPPAFAPTYAIAYTKDIWDSFSLPFTPASSDLDCGAITYKLFLASDDSEVIDPVFTITVNAGPPITTSLDVTGTDLSFEGTETYYI